MVSELELNLSMLWWRILNQEPREIFGAEVAKLRNSSWGDGIPQPGYVGREYERNGIAFVSMNPGGSQGDQPGSTDETQLRALRRFGRCAEADAPHAFPEVMRVLEGVMPTWSIYSNFVAPVLQRARLRLSQVAYLNLVKWRTQQGAALDRLYELSWKHHTREQFNLLEPGFVIAIVRDGKVIFPRAGKLMQEFAEHMAADVKQLVEDEATGQKTYRYVRTGTNHYSFAFTYDCIAWSREPAWSVISCGKVDKKDMRNSIQYVEL